MSTLQFSVIAMIGFVAPLGAQWLNQPTAGIPRTADGKPNLRAPAPRSNSGKPALSGLWRPSVNNGHYGSNIVADVAPTNVLPQAAALFRQRREDLGKDDPSVFQCLPFGPRAITALDMFKVAETPSMMVILFEDLTYRQIFLDGRRLPDDPNPSFMGYSTGHWDGDTLVVQSNGFNDRTWLDTGGHPHSEALRITERYQRRDFGHLELSETLSDPAVSSMPWTIDLEYEFVADTEMLEYVCAENEKDRSHLVGKASDEKKDAVKIAPEVLAKYVGTYELRWPEFPGMVYVQNVTLAGGELFIDSAGKDRKPLVPLSDTLFTMLPGTIQFVEEKGKVTHFVMKSVEGDLKAVRR
jgi:hypothetical protein